MIRQGNKMAASSRHSQFLLSFVVISALLVTVLCKTGRYTPDWKSLDTRPIPSWYDEGKIGIFLHWGVFSVPSFRSEWFWYYWQGSKESSVVKFMEDNYRPDWTYADFAKEFTVQADVYDPNKWADIFNASGARYVVHVTKHHEGFTSWPSKHSFNWNSMDVGPHRDLVDDVSKAVRKYPNLRYGVYHSLFEWFNPIFLRDKANNFTTQDFVKTKSMPELYELVNQYKPDIVWSDGCPDTSDYWTSKEFIAWLYNDSPVKDKVVVNDRWGSDAMCKHGDFLTCNDRYNPGKLSKHKFENAMTLDRHSWGYRRNTQLSDVLSIEELIKTVVTTVSCNGNILINVGPTKDGVIVPIYEERLRQLGSWLGVNGDAIYKTRPWTYQNDTVTHDIWYTTKVSGSTKSVYAFLLDWPDSDVLSLGAPLAGPDTQVTLLGYSGGPLKIDYVPKKQGIKVSVPVIPHNKMPCLWAWVLKFTDVQN